MYSRTCIKRRCFKKKKKGEGEREGEKEGEREGGREGEREGGREMMLTRERRERGKEVA